MLNVHSETARGKVKNMPKGKRKKKKAPHITNIQELSDSRDGGQIALRGYSYQFLYSCYLVSPAQVPIFK